MITTTCLILLIPVAADGCGADAVGPDAVGPDAVEPTVVEPTVVGLELALEVPEEHATAPKASTNRPAPQTRTRRRRPAHRSVGDDRTRARGPVNDTDVF
jgi:hypothetical protein